MRPLSPLLGVSSRVRHAVVVLLGVAVLAALCAASSLADLSGAYDGWLIGLSTVAIGASAVSCLLRARAIRTERMPWTLIGMSLLFTCVALVTPNWLSAVPAWNWLMWCTWYPPVGAGLVLLVRGRVTRVPRSVWLDSVVGGCAVAAVYVDVLLDGYLHGTLRAFAAEVGVAVALGYPLGDLVLLALVTGVLVVHGWRVSRSWGWLVVALTGTAVFDGAQLSGVVPARFATGLWPLFALMFAWAPGSPLIVLAR